MYSGTKKDNKYNLAFQYGISFALIAALTLLSYFSIDFIGYRVVALILLLAVSILAMLFDITPVVIKAILSALVWVFFIPPIFTFHINTPEDALMSLMYLVIAFINTVLTFKIRAIEKKPGSKRKEKKLLNFTIPC